LRGGADADAGVNVHVDAVAVAIAVALSVVVRTAVYVSRDLANRRQDCAIVAP
jgi:hypothetical protein